MSLSFTAFLDRLELQPDALVIETCIGRAGSFFLQSLFDGHPEIVMFPGVLNFYGSVFPTMERYHDDWLGVLRHELCKWYEMGEVYNIPAGLGENQNETLGLDIDQTVARVSDLLGKEFPERRRLLLAVHFALAEQLGIRVDCVRRVFVHEHTDYLSDSWLRSIQEDFPSATILCILKDPRSNYLSIRNWQEKIRSFAGNDWRTEYLQPRAFERRVWAWYKNYLTFFERHPEAVHILRLEDLQTFHQEMLHKLIALLRISWDDSLTSTTFGGKLWSGDRFSKPQAGVRSSANPEKWRKELSELHVAILNTVLGAEMRALGYLPADEPRDVERSIAWLLAPIWLIDDMCHIFSRTYMSARRKQQGTGMFRIFFDNFVALAKGYRRVILGTWASTEYSNLAQRVLCRGNYVAPGECSTQPPSDSPPRNSSPYPGQ